MSMIEIDMTTSSGKDLKQLEDLIEARRKELGETTSQSLKAIALNILRSLRAETEVAKANKNIIEVQDVSGQYYVSWYTIDKGKNRRIRVLRDVKTNSRITESKIYWNVDKFPKNEQYKVFSVVDTAGDKKLEYLIVTKSLSTAKRLARERVKARIRRYKGLARLAISLARKLLFDAGNVDSDITLFALNEALQNIEVRFNDSGYDSGTSEIRVHDKLNYATDALKNKQASIDLAMQNALKSLIGYLRKITDNPNLFT